MKFFILYPFKNGPYGGANQFLRALRSQFIEKGTYTEHYTATDAVIVNINPSSILHVLREVPIYKKRNPDGVVILRVDGPISLVRGRDKFIDKITGNLISLFADGIIYQSHWSRQENHKLFKARAPIEAVIHNAADAQIFYPPKDKVSSTSKTRIIATSWSNNKRKGFDIFEYLDRHLDFSRFEMTFVGNSPIRFRNIKHIPPLPSKELANELRRHDLFITASVNDPCSNSLLEALTCGLPAVVRNSGGHPELVQQGGVLFTNEEDILQVINSVSQNVAILKESLPKYSITKAAKEYLDFAQYISYQIQGNAYSPKKLTVERILRAQIIRLRYAAWLALKMPTPSNEQIRQRPTKYKKNMRSSV